ncbi:DUF4843 domain-containing protein [Pedobacter hiemivivus]|uniref:DUF4843 domain-containing protein n=1 Tax=Pedobacter hiemivivus TaxID=2530454 RepID=A0A4U1G979_9SPHI|nr:DUF4843 domain-containing protein [Pedobacter hiemivivus]TKC60218.1 DUF4843 domain-containing protein [Pedobacter hiemivivus]
MKNIVYSLSILILLVVGACKKSSLITYQGQPDIYFDDATRLPTLPGDIILDSTIVSFAYSTVTDSISKIIIGVTGAKADHDRTYKLEIDPKSTAISGKHYDALPTSFTIRKNKLKDTVLLKMHRTVDLQTTESTLILNLQANENFVTSMADKVINKTTGKKYSYITYKVYINDIVKRPSGWFDTYLGVFSRKKLFLMVDVLNVQPSFFVGQPSLGILGAYGKYMQRYLNDQKAAGKTVFEDDGTEMIMGPGVQ